MLFSLPAILYNRVYNPWNAAVADPFAPNRPWPQGPGFPEKSPCPKDILPRPPIRASPPRHSARTTRPPIPPSPPAPANPPSPTPGFLSPPTPPATGATGIACANVRAPCSKLAAAALLARHWPNKGSQDEAALALTGALLKSPMDGAEHDLDLGLDLSLVRVEPDAEPLQDSGRDEHEKPPPTWDADFQSTPASSIRGGMLEWKPNRNIRRPPGLESCLAAWE